MDEKNKDFSKIIKEQNESLDNKDLIIVALKSKIDNLTKELNDYSFEMIQTAKKGYKIYRLDPYYKENKLIELQDLRDSIDNETIKNIIQECIFIVDKDEIPETVIINSDMHKNVQKYFNDILQNMTDERLHLNKMKLTLYICNNINKIIVK